MTLPPDPATLADREALRQLLQLYARAVDESDHDGLAGLFDPGGTVAGLAGTKAVPAYLDDLRGTPRPYTSMHVFADPVIELDPGADHGRLDAYAVVTQVRRPDEPGPDVQMGLRYQDRVARRDGRWVIAERRVTLLWRKELAPG